ncbi:HlyD family efflux transporter periplasmic adaptor subunit [Aquincola sp. MAHUQ-54]|uniref:HlyD family efflux transporter periplasmic adaptor subunit n=1 Tax=Aquincola agrisoli TaxID=3119538 RepID=A0AAW9QCH7_9BURK
MNAPPDLRSPWPGLEAAGDPAATAAAPALPPVPTAGVVRPAAEPGADRAGLVLALQAAALSHARLPASTAAVATELCTLMACDRVGIGLRKGAACEVVALSHCADVDAERALARGIGAAMDEALDQSATLVWPLPPGEPPRIVHAHAEQARAQGGGHLCTVPLADHGRLVGAMTLERAGPPFDAAEVLFIEHAACLLGPLIELKRQQQRSLPRHLLDAARGAQDRLVGPGHPTAKLLALAAVSVGAAIGVAAWVPGEHRIGAAARVEGAVQRALVAPVDGFIQEVHARPGDAVQPGQLLAELSREELQLERRKWQSEAQQHEHAYGEALARHDRAQMVVALSRADEARAQLDLAEQSLRRSRLEAPFAGVVIQGDLTQALGAPVKRGDVLMTLAQGEGHRVIVEVDEHDIADVRVGQAGRLALAAAPQRPLAIRVERITPVAATIDGRNVFEVEASVDGGPQVLRPGLRGVARIEAGERPLLWIATHRLVDWLRLQWWAWLT